MNKAAKIIGSLLVVCCIGVTGHHAILWGKGLINRIEKKIACHWLSTQMLEQPTEQKNKVSHELMVLESHCWKEKRISKLYNETKKRKV